MLLMHVQSRSGQLTWLSHRDNICVSHFLKGRTSYPAFPWLFPGSTQRSIARDLRPPYEGLEIRLEQLTLEWGGGENKRTTKKRYHGKKNEIFPGKIEDHVTYLTDAWPNNGTPWKTGIVFVEAVLTTPDGIRPVKPDPANVSDGCLLSTAEVGTTKQSCLPRGQGFTPY